MTILDRLTGFVSPAVALRRAIQLSDSGRLAEAFPLMATAARAGIADAEYRVARCYLEGSCVPPSRMEGTHWLRRAADHGNRDAQALLAALYVSGLATAETEGNGSVSERLFEQDSPGKPDFAAALRFAAKAADAGSATGQAILGYILTSGPEAMRDADAAHGWYERSAAAGCAEGCLGFALSLARRGGKSERPRIAEEVRRAADAGLPTAIYLLAVLTEHGLGVTANLAAAERLYRSAAEKGLPSAQFRLGLMLIDGSLVDQDPTAGEAWMRRAALGGNMEAAYFLGDRHAKNRPPDFAEAASWYRRAAEAGHQAAARAIASLYLTGNGVAKDDKEGARWLRVAAEGGSQEAQVDFANLVLGGAGGADDSTGIAGWFEVAATSGDLIAAFNLGLCFAKGVGVRQDEGRAAQWLRRAAEGVAEAQYMYARILQEGRGVATDAQQARAWFAEAADGGVLDAQVALAEMLLNGHGGAHSPTAAVKLFERAAEDGHAGAMFALGALYGSGHGLSVDQTAAQKWFAAAAERGHGHAQLMLGRYLHKGLAGEHNPIAARLWFERAAAQGIAEAADELSEFALGETGTVVGVRP
ncbi:SEL1-like repeat protein [Mesorhizobium sp. ES1-4]|uniref:SEL1-like repeat protein n=1 Tax=Mesorhizobium sp. ES1-4 TaxID=2876627 RepID=UPI001CCEE5E1|nr:tetratricopeptide repeat protein [Mesorhizobium sp. ES1-4]MBZ9800033.1 sel1 repeat family protein [Mesorhizobium sp. ES1-4]